MSAFLNLIPRSAFLAVIVALAALAGYLTYGLHCADEVLAQANQTISSLKISIEESNTRAATQAANLKSEVIKAQNEAKQREQILRGVINAAATESNGLRNDLDAMREQFDYLSRDAIAQRATAVASVLGECSKRYAELAEKADRHASDVKTLMAAWPK